MGTTARTSRERSPAVKVSGQARTRMMPDAVVTCASNWVAAPLSWQDQPVSPSDVTDASLGIAVANDGALSWTMVEAPS